MAEHSKYVKMPVWTLAISHRHGEGVEIFESEETARIGLHKWVELFWEDEHERGNLKRKKPPEDPETAIAEYFGNVDSEDYSIEPGAVNITDPVLVAAPEMLSALYTFLHDARYLVTDHENLTHGDIETHAQGMATYIKDLLSRCNLPGDKGDDSDEPDNG
jgi:hypothetical protein